MANTKANTKAPVSIPAMEARLRKAPPVAWRKLLDQAAELRQTGILSDTLSYTAVWMVRLAAYVNTRDLYYTDKTDKAHQRAVKASNRAAAAARKALGFAYPKDDLTF